MPGADAKPMGRYAVHAELASGGMASVHFARLIGPSGFTRTVALKRPHPQLAKEREFAMMFIDEARLASRIRHTNVVSTLDVIETPDELALVMDYVHGDTLAKLVSSGRARGEAVPLPIAAAIVIDALRGLHAAHEATDEHGQPLGIVHRDVSPQNLLVGADGITRVADFGVAKAAGRLLTTRDGEVKGKYAYMAPEQIRGEGVTRLTDVYAASIVLWELLTSRSLFRGETDAETIHKCLQAEVPPPSSIASDVPAVFDAILARGLARDPGERYPSARAMAADLERAAPPVRASEVGAWVEHLAAGTLAARAAVIAQMERGQRASTATSSELTPTVAAGLSQDVSIVSEVSHTRSVAERLPAAAGRRRWWALAWIALLVPAIAVTGVLLAGPRRGSSASGGQASPSASAAAPDPASATAASAASQEERAPEPASPSAASASVAPGSPGGVGASPAAGSSTARPAGKAGRGTRGKGGKGGAGCNPPYIIDSAGRELFKVECL